VIVTGKSLAGAEVAVDGSAGLAHPASAAANTSSAASSAAARNDRVMRRVMWGSFFRAVSTRTALKSAKTHSPKPGRRVFDVRRAVRFGARYASREPALVLEGRVAHHSAGLLT